MSRLNSSANTSMSPQRTNQIELKVVQHCAREAVHDGGAGERPDASHQKLDEDAKYVFQIHGPASQYLS